MKTETLKVLILIVIAVLLASEIASWIGNLFGATSGIFGGLIMAAVYWYCARKARASLKYYLWILVPTLLFTVLPLFFTVYDSIKGEEESFAMQLIHTLPFLFSFALPVILLLVAYFGIQKLEKR